MQLIEVLSYAKQWEGDAGTIYVERPWSENADAVILDPAPDTNGPLQQSGRTYDYFLETFIVRDFLDDFALSPEGKSASEKDKCDRLICYALDDA